MQHIEAVIYDCDGVMFESRQANLAFYNTVLAEYRYPPVTLDQKERAHLCHTASTPNVLRGLLEPEHLPQALAFASQLDYRQFIPYMVPELHLSQTLAQLKERFHLAIATNRGRSIDQVLEHFSLKEYFSAVVTSHDVARPKPDPDMLLLAAEKLGVGPGRCLFIGDSELDMAAAQKAGMSFIAYGKVAGGDLVIRNHLELLEVLAA